MQTSTLTFQTLVDSHFTLIPRPKRIFAVIKTEPTLTSSVIKPIFKVIKKCDNMCKRCNHMATDRKRANTRTGLIKGMCIKCYHEDYLRKKFNR